MSSGVDKGSFVAVSARHALSAEVLGVVQLRLSDLVAKLKRALLCKVGLHTTVDILGPEGRLLDGASTLAQAGLSDGCTVDIICRHRAVAITSSQDNTVKLWDTETGDCLRTLQSNEVVSSACFSPDGRNIVTASWDRCVKLWDAEDGKCLRTLAGHSDKVQSAVFSLDGCFVASASKDCTARLWDANGGECLQIFAGHDSSVVSAAFSPSGCHIATASTDCSAKMWNAATASCIFTCEGHKKAITAVAFSPDGRRIATGSLDGTAKSWDAQKADCRVTLQNQGLQAIATVRLGYGYHPLAFWPDLWTPWSRGLKL
eukprot:gnl/TRDRNA2_/TRDRNA2_138867_c0_seq3.p1 gnl/TRDRNA2_/TRDRNA2_138867_c0~~gnl/TRDRNA2_/TRDRNA2_138867_c0_seq3.p1  ORF type:complete len:316 (+),score=41.11 gnl/TRDRNA2_/TRDRNA2_138867_c0_seq3:156-1103(+)